MKILLTNDSGEVLDSEEITREEWDNLTTTGAGLILLGLNPGTATS